MAAPEEDGSNWLLDLGFEDIPLPGGKFPPLEPGYEWHSNAILAPAPPSIRQDESCVKFDVSNRCSARKRMKSGACSGADSKAQREKMRRFQELSCVMDPGKPPKMDKSAILSDAVRMVLQLRDEAQKLKESFEDLQEQVNELKAEKNELKDEKQKLKEEKDKLELQLKALNSRPGFLPHPPATAVPFPVPHQLVGGKLVPFVGYPGIPMWQFAAPAVIDTPEDHSLPPVA
ncbi:transcription factor bHLH115-like isoform X2 [Ipomoea triloba]|uniref:transcription factor bHLH115-like isoform X2 n=1 Tax=Ipomoea triloba TaxID=35885 RepID=UPI00125D21DC|nr:transcription factor bHLH115-like isoform X2 [Ipomoea triloba]